MYFKAKEIIYVKIKFFAFTIVDFLNYLLGNRTQIYSAFSLN